MASYPGIVTGTKVNIVWAECLTAVEGTHCPAVKQPYGSGIGDPDPAGHCPQFRSRSDTAL